MGVTEIVNVIMKIDKVTYKIEEKNYYKTKHKKTQIILGGTGRESNHHILRFQKREHGNYKGWNTFTISREGLIYQHYNPKCYTDFMGIKEVDKKSISILLENMGNVWYDGDDDKYINPLLEVCPEDLVYQKLWREMRYWEKYTDEQMESTVFLCKHLIKEYRIPLNCVGYHVLEDGLKDFEGITSRGNYDVKYLDLNPSFDFNIFMDKMGIDNE